MFGCQKLRYINLYVSHYPSIHLSIYSSIPLSFYLTILLSHYLSIPLLLYHSISLSNNSHQNCHINTVVPKKYFCQMCISGYKPLYNEVVLCRFLDYRWWAAHIVPPPFIPESMAKPRNHQFLVKFSRMRDYAWMQRQHFYAFQLDEAFRKSLVDAKIVHQHLNGERKPPKYTILTTNWYVG